MWRTKSILYTFAAQKTLDDAKKVNMELHEYRRIAEHRAQNAERKVRELQAKLEGGRDSSELDILQQEMEDERAQHQKEIAERDFTTDQTRKKYQGSQHSTRYLQKCVLLSP
jgi:myosin heavy chain 9/10/11/14